MPKKGFKKGDLVSVWSRNSKRHKWIMECSLGIIVFIDNNECTIQTSDTGTPTDGGKGVNGCSSFAFSGYGTWQRELRNVEYWSKKKCQR